MRVHLVLLLSLSVALAGIDAAVVADHPRLFVTAKELPALAERCAGPLAEDYAALKQQADHAVKSGRIRYLDNKWATPGDLMACGLTYLIERTAGRPHQPYADVIITAWGDGGILKRTDVCAFGWHALAYDWIFDALDDDQRKRYGDALGTWLTWYTGEARITLKSGSWDYNQTWGPSHLNIPHSRDAITQKLFIALAITGAGTRHEADARSFLDSWATRIPRDCIPYFDDMGGSWSESHGHGAYGPIQVIPYAFEAWRTATGENFFLAGKPWSFLREMSRWLAYLQVPHSGRLAYLDDGGGAIDGGFAHVAPFVARGAEDSLAQWFAAARQDRGSWTRIVGTDLSRRPASPADLDLPLGYLLPGSGHVFMRSAWNDPNATWAFFGAGPHRVGHQHDDEGHFLISRRGGLVSKGGGGGGGNDEDHYWGGSLAFNILTIFDPSEQMRRTKANESDGGLLRHVYVNERVERGRIVAFHHDRDLTYAASDLTQAYHPGKAAQVTRQFLYLRGEPGVDEYVVVCDRVRSTKADFAKHFVLHVPTEPTITGQAQEVVPGRVSIHSGEGLVSSWLSEPEDFGKDKVLSTGRARIFLKTLLPEGALITKRGGEGHANWGHPLEPSAQYDHTGTGRDKPPFCPWRLEVAAPLEEQTVFLHVFHIADDPVTAMAPVAMERKGSELDLSIGSGSRTWTVRLPTTGDLTATVTAPGSKRAKNLRAEVDVTGQYP